MPDLLPPDLATLHDQLDAAERDARDLVSGLSEADGAWRPAAGAWSIAECLDHLATGNRVYLAPMQAAAESARREGNWRKAPATPGWAGWWFVRYLEPPPKWWTRLPAPKSIRPNVTRLGEAFAGFLASQQALRGFLTAHADLDFTSTRFPNPFIRIPFRLATGMHVLTAHERRHLLQARTVRLALESLPR